MGAEFVAVGKRLLDEFDHPGPFRLVGMTAFDLAWRDDPLQLDLLEDANGQELEVAIDRLIERFGTGTVMRASDLQDRATVVANGANLDFLDHRDGERLAVPVR